MGVYQDIVVGTDASATSFAVVDRAGGLAGADRAIEAGATEVETVVTRGEPAHVLRDAVSSHQADLLVVGNGGLNTIAGRFLGSLPAEVARHSGVDVLIVRAT